MACLYTLHQDVILPFCYIILFHYVRNSELMLDFLGNEIKAEFSICVLNSVYVYSLHRKQFFKLSFGSIIAFLS